MSLRRCWRAGLLSLARLSSKCFALVGIASRSSPPLGEFTSPLALAFSAKLSLRNVNEKRIKPPQDVTRAWPRPPRPSQGLPNLTPHDWRQDRFTQCKKRRKSFYLFVVGPQNKLVIVTYLALSNVNLPLCSRHYHLGLPRVNLRAGVAGPSGDGGLC